VTAFLDRIHAYLPGWEVPKLTPQSYARDYGFITDYFCEIMHELRRIDVLAQVRKRFELIETANTAGGLSGRDQRAVLKVAGGLLRLLYPHGELSDEELGEVLLLACELRQRVREQLHVMAPGEYDKVQLGAKLLRSGAVAVPTLADSGRAQRINLPEAPTVGEVVGLAVEGDHGCILRFEMQATRGTGRIVPLGSIQSVMRESIEAATQYIRA
jgi:ATP-dependent Lon protease